MKGIDKLYTGDFNSMSQEWQPDSSVIITLLKRGEDELYSLHVKDLYGENEKVLKDKTFPIVIPHWIKDRQDKAKKPKKQKGD